MADLVSAKLKNPILRVMTMADTRSATTRMCGDIRVFAQSAVCKLKSFLSRELQFRHIWPRLAAFVAKLQEHKQRSPVFSSQ